jgi:hypothetical protein
MLVASCLQARVIFAIVIEKEKEAVEDICDQQHNVQRQKRISEPGEDPRPPSADAQIGDDKMAHHENGYRDRDVVGRRIEIQDPRPAKSRKNAPKEHPLCNST